MDIHRNSTALSETVTDWSAWDDDVDVGAVTGERLVDRVVQDLKHHVMQAGAVIGVANVLPGRLRTASRPFKT